MKDFTEKYLEDIRASKDDFSRELIIYLDLVPGIIHEINNSLSSSMVSTELLQGELVNLKKQIKENSINIKLINHIEKLSKFNKKNNPKIQNIIDLLLKEEILLLKNQFKKNNIEDVKFDRLDNLLSLNLNGVKKIDLILKAFRRLISYEDDIDLIDVNEVLKNSILILKDQLNVKYTVSEDYSEIPLVNSSFHKLNYSIICILLRIIELMDTGELLFKTYESEDNVDIQIQLKDENISKYDLSSIIKGDKSKVDLFLVNKILENIGATLDILTSGDKLDSELENHIIEQLIFHIKIKKDLKGNFVLRNQMIPAIQTQENISFHELIPNNIESNNKSKNILIVDDDPQTLLSLFSSVKRHDFNNKVFIAKNADAGTKQLKERDFCLVICDYKLPGMNGVNFLTKIKNEYPTTKRVLITAFLNNKLKEEAMNKAEVNHIIEKPWANENITKLIQGLLEQK